LYLHTDNDTIVYTYSTPLDSENHLREASWRTHCNQSQRYALLQKYYFWKKIFYAGVMSITVPSLAMFQFRSQYLPKDIIFSEVVDDFYESYYGGRTEAFRIGKVKAEVRILFVWPKDAKDPIPVTNLVRMSRGEMIGVKFNKDKDWVGGTIGMFEK
jgi:hypothetical protein